MLCNFATYLPPFVKPAFVLEGLFLACRRSGIIGRRTGHRVGRSLLRVRGRIVKHGLLSRLERRNYCNFAYSVLASFRIGMSGSASFQSVRKSL
jgi:hypothetical protein